MNQVINNAKHKIETIMKPNCLTAVEYICGHCGDFISINKKNSGTYEVKQNFILIDTIKIKDAA